MNVDLDPGDKKAVEELARAVGKEVGTVLRELVHDAIAERRRNGCVADADDEVIRRQREALVELHAELDALPAEGDNDGFSGRDHDKALQERKAKPRFGSARGKIEMGDSFDAPLEDFRNYMQ